MVLALTLSFCEKVSTLPPFGRIPRLTSSQAWRPRLFKMALRVAIPISKGAAIARV